MFTQWTHPILKGMTGINLQFSSGHLFALSKDKMNHLKLHKDHVITPFFGTSENNAIYSVAIERCKEGCRGMVTTDIMMQTEVFTVFPTNEIFVRRILEWMCSSKSTLTNREVTMPTVLSKNRIIIQPNQPSYSVLSKGLCTPTWCMSVLKLTWCGYADQGIYVSFNALREVNAADETIKEVDLSKIYFTTSEFSIRPEDKVM